MLRPGQLIAGLKWGGVALATISYIIVIIIDVAVSYEMSTSPVIILSVFMLIGMVLAIVGIIFERRD